MFRSSVCRDITLPTSQPPLFPHSSTVLAASSWSSEQLSRNLETEDLGQVIIFSLFFLTFF